MKALIVYGSKNGSTKDIAEVISTVLKNEGFEVDIKDAELQTGSVTRYDLVIVGSSLYLRSWLKSSVRFVRRNQEELRNKPVWLFSSGLRSDDPRSLRPKILSEFERTIMSHDHHFFPGSLDPQRMGGIHRSILRLPGIRAIFPIGDLRDWNEIRSWAKTIALAMVNTRGQAGNAGIGRIQVEHDQIEAGLPRADKTSPSLKEAIR